MPDIQGLDREQLSDRLDFALDEEEPDWRYVSELKARLRTCCSHCDREGADDHHDTHGIFVTRAHEHCLTPSDKHMIGYRWQPGDEPLEED